MYAAPERGCVRRTPHHARTRTAGTPSQVEFIMKKQRLWKLSVPTTPEAAEAISELLTNQFSQPASSFTDLERQVTTVSMFLPAQPDWTGPARARLRAGLRHISTCGLDIGAARITLAPLRETDWAEVWKRHFKPIDLGALLVKPSW